MDPLNDDYVDINNFKFKEVNSKKLTMTNGFCELNENEMMMVDGGTGLIGQCINAYNENKAAQSRLAAAQSKLADQINTWVVNGYADKINSSVYTVAGVTSLPLDG